MPFLNQGRGARSYLNPPLHGVCYDQLAGCVRGGKLGATHGGCLCWTGVSVKRHTSRYTLLSNRPIGVCGHQMYYLLKITVFNPFQCILAGWLIMSLCMQETMYWWRYLCNHFPSLNNHGFEKSLINPRGIHLSHIKQLKLSCYYRNRNPR